MAREKKPEEAGPSKLYLVSFGDTMTTLLAFFIVLCSLADDQTGANLYNGTGSFVNAMGGSGTSGSLSGDHGARSVQLQAAGPKYPVPTDGEQEDDGKKGPDEDNSLRSIDREKEELQRFLNEMSRLSKVDREPNSEGEVVFDLFERLNRKPPLFTATYNSILSQVIPLLRQPAYRTEIIVWAKNPGPFAIRAAFEQSASMRHELTEMSGLSQQQQGRLSAVARPWAYPDAQRPVVSIVMRKLELAAN